MRRLPSLAAIALLTLPILPASAAPVTETFRFNASGFADLTGLSAPPPVDPVALSLVLSFDPAAGDQFDNMAGITLLASNLPIAGGLAFDYDSVRDILTFGGAGLGGVGVAAGTSDVLIQVSDPYTGGPTLDGFIYTNAASQGIFEATAGGVAVSVPEPGSLALLFGGVLLLVGRRRRA